MSAEWLRGPAEDAGVCEPGRGASAVNDLSGQELLVLITTPVPKSCDPWLGPREWFQYEARKVLEITTPHLWMANSCPTVMCLSGHHLRTLQPEPLDYMQGVCVYCGLSANTKDHLIPRGWSGESARSFVLTVPSCRECNSFIGAQWAPTINERRVIAQRKIKSRYRAALRVHRFTKEDLAEMGPNLRSMVDAKHSIAAIIRDRLEWPGDEFYDFGACYRAGFEDPYEAGLLRPPNDGGAPR